MGNLFSIRKNDSLYGCRSCRKRVEVPWKVGRNHQRNQLPLFAGMKKEDIQAQGISLPVYPLYHSLKALLLRRPGHVPGSLQSVVHERYIDLKVSPRVGRPGDCFIGFRPQRNLPLTSSDPYVIGAYTIPWQRRICQGAPKKKRQNLWFCRFPGPRRSAGRSR